MTASGLLSPVNWHPRKPKGVSGIGPGFGEEFKLPVLAKLMFAERFLSSLFDQIATVAVTDSKEHCADLAMLEKVDTPESSKSPAKTR